MFGGARGLRDEGLLDSALARPQNLLAYLPASTIAEMAASYCCGVVKNHAFVDGNKRAAFLSVGLFLAINGYRLVADPLDAIRMVLAVADGSVAEKMLASWIEANIEPTS